MIMIKTQFQWKTNGKWCVILNDLERSFQLPDTSTGLLPRKIQHISPTKLIAWATTTAAFECKYFSRSFLDAQLSC